MVREVGREPACHFYPLPVVLILPGTPPSHMGWGQLGTQTTPPWPSRPGHSPFLPARCVWGPVLPADTDGGGWSKDDPLLQNSSFLSTSLTIWDTARG